MTEIKIAYDWNYKYLLKKLWTEGLYYQKPLPSIVTILYHIILMTDCLFVIHGKINTQTKHTSRGGGVVNE